MICLRDNGKCVRTATLQFGTGVGWQSVAARVPRTTSMVDELVLVVCCRK